MKKLTIVICVFLFTSYYLLAQEGTNTSISNRRNINYLISELQSQIKINYFDKEKGRILIDKLDEMLSKQLLDTSSLENVALKITEMLRQETNDKHFNLVAFNPKQSQPGRPQLQNISGGLSELKILDHNIGYLKWDHCIDGEYSLKKIKNALDFLEGCSALIIDISENPGGGGESSAFINHSLYASKDYQNLLIKKCSGDTSWYQSEVAYNYIGGPKFYDTPLYIIVSNKTASASEYFAFTAKEMKRGKILGKTTAGAGNPGYWNIFIFAGLTQVLHVYSYLSNHY